MSKPEVIHKWGSVGVASFRMVHNGEADRDEAVIIERYDGKDSLGAERWREVETVRVGWFAVKDRLETAQKNQGGTTGMVEMLAVELYKVIQDFRRVVAAHNAAAGAS